MAKAGIKRAAANVGRAKQSKSRTAPKGRNAKTKRFKRPNSLTLSDLFLWVTVVDECQHHPHGALERAAVVEGLKAGGNLNQRLTELESHFGKLFFDGSNVRPRGKRPAGGRRNRSAVPNLRGAALAEIFVLIEYLYRWATALGGWPEQEYEDLKEFKQTVLPLLHLPPLRTLERSPGSNRINRSIVWRSRLEKRARTGSPAKFSDLEGMPPEPMYQPSDLAQAGVERRRKKRMQRKSRKMAKA